MEVYFYKTSDDNNVINKNLTDEVQTDVIFKSGNNILNPSLTINESLIDLNEYNYVYIPNNGRYYYIVDVMVLPHNMLHLALRTDVLMSFKNQLLAITGTVDRNEFLRNGYLNDENYKALSYTQIVTKKFPYGMENDSFILMTIG